MADSAQVEKLKQGREAWNDWRVRNQNVLIDLRNANLRAAKLEADQLRGTGGASFNLSGADLRGADLRGANLRGPYYPSPDLMRLNLDGVRGDGDLTNVDLRDADLRGAELTGTNLSGADLRGATLAGISLSGACLKGADLRGLDLSGIQLNRGSLNGANLNGTNLSRGNLNRTDLRNTTLTYSDVRNAHLSLTNLVNANLTGAPIEGATISHAFLGNTVFGDLDLRTVAGLDTCRHLGPSILDQRTLMKSGQLPLAFLRGCGLPDRLIDYLPSLLATPVQFYSCFISYASADEAFAKQLHADLQNRGVRCWFAPQSVKAGQKIHEQIDEAIRGHDKLLLILSLASMSSEWVKSEISKARQQEVPQGRRMLFPVSLVEFERLRGWECFDADIGKDSAKEIREYFIPDFSNWKDSQAYKRAFEQLLGDLMSH